jgi:L-asparaginase/Glu-tRNA(Gln) amidotransferase subunit D
MDLENVKEIANIIANNYQSYSSFIVVTGLDTICHVGTALSFML